MAEKRMFAKSIVLSDAFLDMPMSARCLYFTLGMLADDDGFVSAPKSIMRQCGASQDDMSILIAKRYILAFESGVIVIKHWRINNYLRADRYVETTYLEEKNTLSLDKKGAYTEAGIPPGIPSIEEYREVEGRLEEISLEQSSSDQKERREEDTRAGAREAPPYLAAEKKLYGNFVRLSLHEYAALLNEIGIDEFARCRALVDKEKFAKTEDWAALICRCHAETGGKHD